MKQVAIDLGYVTQWFMSLSIKGQQEARQVLNELAINPESAPVRNEEGGIKAYTAIVYADSKKFRVTFGIDPLLSRFVPAIIVTKAVHMKID